MGWWSLGPEDEEPMEMTSTLPVRRARGGAGRVPGQRGKDRSPTGRKTRTRTRSPEKSKQTKRSPKKKRPRVVGIPNEEELNLFASIGQLVNSSNPRPASDLSTLGTAKYPGQNGIPVNALNNNATEAQRRANEMANAMAWLTNPSTTTTAQESSQSVSDLFQNSENWWESEEAGDSTLKTEEMPDLMALLEHGRKISYSDNEINVMKHGKKPKRKFKANGKELTAEKQAKDLQKSLQWLQENSTSYAHERLEYTEEPFQTVDAGFRQWTPKTTPSLDWERFDSLSETVSQTEAQRIAKDLKECLDLILNASFDNNPSSHNGPIVIRLKNLFAEWKFRENDGSKELEDALRWFKLHAQTYDPIAASEEENGRFLKSKRLLAILGFKEDVWDEHKQEMEEVLASWASDKSKPIEDLDEHTIEKMKKINDVLLQIKRDGLTVKEMTDMAKEMETVLSWYLAEDHEIKDISHTTKSYESNFQKAQGLLSLWGRKVEPLPNRLKDVVELLFTLEGNKCSSEIVDKYNADERSIFQKLQDSVTEWKFKGLDANSNTSVLDEQVTNDIERALDWWVENVEIFEVETSNEDEVCMAQIAKIILELWNPSLAGDEFGAQDAKFVVTEIKEALLHCRKGLEEQEVPEELSEDASKDIGINNRQATATDMSWRRKKTGQDFNDKSGHVDGDKDPKSVFSGVVPVVLSDEEKRAREMSSALDWLRHKHTELDIDDEMSVALSVATFKKIDALMPKTGDVLAPATMDGALDWLRSKTTLDDETICSFKKVDDVLTRSGAFESIKESGFAGALEWLRKRQAKKSASNVGVGSTCSDNDAEYIAISAMPTSEDGRRAAQMESALDWLRSNDPSEDLSAVTTPGSLRAGSASTSTINSNRPGDNLSTAVDWLRSGVTKTIADPTCNSTGVQYIADHPSSSDDRLITETNVLHWCRYDEASAPTDESNGELEVDKAEERRSVSVGSNKGRKIEDVGTEQSWVRNSSQNDCKVDDDRWSGGQGVKPVSSEEKGILRIHKATDWSRTSQNVDSAIKGTSESMSVIMSSDRTPKQRSRDLENIVRWMRKGKGKGQKREEKYDPTGQYRELDNIMQIKIGETPKDRSLQIEFALDWIRSRNGASEHDMEPTLDSSSKFGFVPITARSSSSQQTSKSHENTNDWMANPRTGEQQEFQCVDSTLSEKKSQDARRHQINLPDVIDWHRNHPTDLRDDALPLNRSHGVHMILRDDSPREVEINDAGWLAHIDRLFPAVTGEQSSYGKHDMLNAIPFSRERSQDSENHDLDWIRYPGIEVQMDDETESYYKARDVQSIPRDGSPKNGNIPNADWYRSCKHLNPILGEEDLCASPRDVRSVPRSGRIHEPVVPELSWQRNPAWDTNETVSVYERPGDLRSIPRNEYSTQESYPSIGWDRNGNGKQEMKVYEGNIFDRPGDLRSIPRDANPNVEDCQTIAWGRNGSRPTGLEEVDTVFDGPGDIRSIPREGRQKESYDPELTWGRNGSSRTRLQEEVATVFDAPGDVGSIPRDGSHRGSNDPEFTWKRQASVENIPGVDCGNIFDRPGDLRSIPREGRRKEMHYLECTWERHDSLETTPRVDYDYVFDRPGDLSSIPRDGRQKELHDPEFTWERHASFESISGMDYGNVYDQPGNLRAIPRDGDPRDEPDKNMRLEYDWSGGRPDRLLTVQPSSDWIEPGPAKWSKGDVMYDWMITSPASTEANYDWSGARPYERPERNLVMLSTTSLDEASSGVNERFPDDLSEYTELGEEKSRPITGVPCAAWTMLALGAAAGGAMANGTAPQGAAVAFQFANNNSVGSTTDRLYPDPGALPSCSTDANCQIIMDGLSPVLPPDVLGLFDMPGTCQTKARDWLRTGKDILEFKAERIRQRYAMSVFFCEMDGGDWIEGDSWLSDLHECDWYNKVGLDPCNRSEQMEMLRVADNGLAGTLPVELFILSNLYEFTLANNLMSGTLPQLFDKFKELDTLVIPFNQFEGSFPHQIWEYPDMVYLDVAYNGFTGTIPTDIDSRMPNLQVVFLENNNLSGPIPGNLGNLKQLHRLHLDDNKFTGKIPPTLGLPPRLSELLLHDNLLTGEVPKDLGDLNRLQLLTLHYNSFDEQTIDEHICDLIYNKQLELATVDKSTIDCGCCASGEESFV